MTDYLPLIVDFDGTLAEALWTPENPTSVIGAPIRVNILKVREAHRAGWNIVVFTARPWGDETRLEQWLFLHGIPFQQVICNKPLGAAYVDDRNIDVRASSWIPAKDALSHACPATALSSTLSDENTAVRV